MAKVAEHSIINGQDHKKCSVCKEFVFVEDFYRCSENKDGLQGRCKSCATDTVYKKYNSSKKAKDTGERYRNSEKGLAWRSNYVESDKGAFAVLRASQNYRHSLKGKKQYEERDKRYRNNKKEGTLTVAEWHRCLEFFNGCAYCGSTQNICQDHFFPLNSGGTYTLDNILPACKSCNSRKQDKEPSNWIDSYVAFEKVEKIIKYFEEVVLL